MRNSLDEVPVWELRMRIANEIAELRLHYGALMPPLPYKPARLAWNPDGARRPPAAPGAHRAGNAAAPRAAVDLPA
jgi:hypothetical protein